MKKGLTIAIGAIATLALTAGLGFVFYPVLSTPKVARAWRALGEAGSHIVKFKQASGRWPDTLTEVPYLPIRQFDGVAFVYDPQAHTLLLPARYERNPIRLVSRGRRGRSETDSDLLLKLEGLDLFTVHKTTTLSDDYFSRYNTCIPTGGQGTTGSKQPIDRMR